MIWAIKHFLWLVVAMCRAGTLGARSGLQPCPLYLIITYTLLLQLFSFSLISFCLFSFFELFVHHISPNAYIYTLLLQTIIFFLILRLVNCYHLHPIARDFPPSFLHDIPSLICPPSYLRRAAPGVSISWNKVFTLRVGFRLRIGAMQINHREFVKMVPPSNHPGSNASQWLVTTFWQFLPDSIQNRE